MWDRPQSKPSRWPTRFQPSTPSSWHSPGILLRAGTGPTHIVPDEHAEPRPGVRRKCVFAQRRILHERLHRRRALAATRSAAKQQTLTEIIESTVSASLRADAFGMFEQMASYHPSAPHWYLPLIGVDPAHQGKGHGDALMTYALQRCDHDHVAAFWIHEPSKHSAVPA